MGSIYTSFNGFSFPVLNTVQSLIKTLYDLVPTISGLPSLLSSVIGQLYCALRTTSNAPDLLSLTCFCKAVLPVQHTCFIFCGSYSSGLLQILGPLTASLESLSLGLWVELFHSHLVLSSLQNTLPQLYA